MAKRKTKPEESTAFIISKKRWRKLVASSSAKFKTCFPTSMNGIGMLWEYCCNRCVDWTFGCCTKCGHNQGCKNSPYATRRKTFCPVSKEVVKIRGFPL